MHKTTPKLSYLELARRIGTWLDAGHFPADVRSIYVVGSFARGEWPSCDETELIVIVADDSSMLRDGQVVEPLRRQWLRLPASVVVRYATASIWQSYARLHPAEVGWSVADQAMLLWGEKIVQAGWLGVPAEVWAHEMSLTALERLLSIATALSMPHASTWTWECRLKRDVMALLRCLLWKRLGVHVPTFEDVRTASQRLFGIHADQLLDESAPPPKRWEVVMDLYISTYGRGDGASHRNEVPVLLHDWWIPDALVDRDAVVAVPVVALPTAKEDPTVICLLPDVLDEVLRKLVPFSTTRDAEAAARELAVRNARRRIARYAFCWLGECESAMEFGVPSPQRLARQILAVIDSIGVLSGNQPASSPEAVRARLAEGVPYLPLESVRDLIAVVDVPSRDESWLDAYRRAAASLERLLPQYLP